ncbi:MAG: sigma factor-like helix-turn-helix DNA-binding protein [Candidatus Paceibacterota bacterium]
MNTLQTKPKQVTKKLIEILPERAYTVVVSRYGLGSDPKKMTLESIGQNYGITRERVRQIENYAIDKIKQSGLMTKERKIFDELLSSIDSLGGIVQEDQLFNRLSTKEDEKNHIHLLLVLGDEFTKEKEDDRFNPRWYIDKYLADKVHTALLKLHDEISENDLISEDEILRKFSKLIVDAPKKHVSDREILKGWLLLSKKIGSNSLGEWGLSSSSSINAKGMRDYAYLIIRQHGSPMHFVEVTKKIEEVFGKKAHIATCHNELIKDPRFVLVGRGLYALKEWGYMVGVVKDVVKQILKQNGPMTKEEIIKAVLKERYVKDNTILVNLQDSKTFKKTKDGKYALI